VTNVTDTVPPDSPPVPRWALHRRLYDWVLSFAEHKQAVPALFLISFAESSFFPIPPDILLIPLCLGALRRALFFAFICSLASVLGGAAGYAIGMWGWEFVDQFFYRYVPGFSEAKFAKVEVWYGQWGWPLVFLAGFSPIPYKIFTIASGVLAMAFPQFLFASAVSRSARFFLVAILIAWFGQPLRVFIERHFNLLSLLFGLLLVGGFMALKMLH